MNQAERRKYLIEQYRAADPAGGSITVPEDEEQQKDLLRSMMDKRLSVPEGGDFACVRDAYLREELLLNLASEELTLPALPDNLASVQGFIEERLEAAGCPLRAVMQISVAVEEIFVNIAHYAYKPGTGDATVRFAITEDPKAAVIIFMDSGSPFDPLAKENPDTTLSAEERPIGGLGIYITRKTMDYVAYGYMDGHNILTLRKNL